MVKHKLHIVCLDVPFPADYGGAIDMFYRIKALHHLNYELTLHVYEYGRGKQKELEKYGKVIYYKRKKSVFHLLSSRPFVVQSRKSKVLLDNLRKDKNPILFEGIHTAWPLEFEDIQRRTTFIRMHNVEHDYYKGLQSSSGLLKKLFFESEAKKLKTYQWILTKCSHVLAIKESDADRLRKFNSSTFVLPASFPDLEGKYQIVKPYALFHGNLSVPENDQAAKWIIKTLLPVLDPNFPLIIAGKNPSKHLISLCKKNSIKLYVNPYDELLHSLVQEAHTHVLHTLVPSGIKLKLLACIYSSGHVLMNKEMQTGTGIDDLCVIADDPKDYKMHFLGLKTSVVTKEVFLQREKFINQHFNNDNNCRLITKLIEDENAVM